LCNKFIQIRQQQKTDLRQTRNISRAFIGELAAKKIGETVNLKVSSNGKEKNISMKLEAFNYSQQQRR